MCRRNSLFPPASVLENRFEARLVIDDYAPRYNIAPGAEHPTVTNAAPDELRGLTWGFAAPWSDGDDGVINARAETVDERSLFVDAWAEHPCLVPSSGFYEWQERSPGGNQPYRIFREDDPAFALAGLWNGDDRMTILTTTPNETVAPIHDRMPVVLLPGQEDTWLHGGPNDREELCRPHPYNDLIATPIARAVNDPANDHPGIIEPVDDPQTNLDQFEWR